MNYWLDLSIQYANQRSYLDDLFKIYPTIPEGIRSVNEKSWALVEKYFTNQDDELLLRELLKFDLFPIKDSYVAFLRMDEKAMSRNPQTVRRLCGRLYEMGIEELFKKCTEPKETNRQIGPMFRNWLKSKALGLMPVTISEFLKNDDDAILDAYDTEAKRFAAEHFYYRNKKGLDFIARINKKVIIGEAKFLTDDGGHQNAQFNDAISLLFTQGVSAIRIAILDGVLYIKNNKKNHLQITQNFSEENIMSALVLRDFLYSIK